MKAGPLQIHLCGTRDAAHTPSYGRASNWNAVHKNKILNSSILLCCDKLEYERHAEVIIEECEVQSCRAAKTPGVQEAVVDGIEKSGIEMDDQEMTRFRGVAAKKKHLALDRSDLQFV